MKNKIIITLSALGIAFGIFSAIVFNRKPKPQAPVFNPASNPYPNGIHASGIVESLQSDGQNVNIYPEVSGPVTRVLAVEGATVAQGTPLLAIDDSVQRATTEQQRAQADAAGSLLAELRAQPRPEALEVALAQVENARASLKSQRDQLEKLQQSYDLEPKSVSRNTLDSAADAVAVAETNLKVVQKQYELTKAGAWDYDIRNQESQFLALTRAYGASSALLGKYTIRAPIDGVVLSIGTSSGSYVSPQGAYNTYTEGFGPLVVMGAPQDKLQVRCYVDEILVHRLPESSRTVAQMFIQGTDIHIPLTFVRVQPYVSPKIELSDQREERVDVRVLPIIFQFEKPKGLSLYPGQLVDVYVGEK